MTGYAITGSFCTHAKSIEQLTYLINNNIDIIPIVSENVWNTDTRFGNANTFIKQIEDICKRKAVHTICEAEKFGPSLPLDSMIIAPCTGNTLAKLAHGITDTAVCMAAKAHMRQSRPLLIALASNDALSANLSNIATMLCKKNVYFVPLRQDDPAGKPHSLVADFDRLPEAYEAMLNFTQLRPVFI